MTQAQSQFPPGTVLLGKYRIEHVLGAGGMGVVAMATHLQLNERVALKFLLPEVMSNQEVVQRFLREAQAAVKLKGEHVARVIDVGTLEDGVPYMVMEYLEGGDLSQLLAESGPLPSMVAVDYALQACAALAEAHAIGIVHRDIKPANFFVTRRPDGSALLKMLDFGISKAPVGVDQGLTRTQAVMGTPAYMSPEQMRSSRDVDARSDIWSLGVVIYELLAGMRPFRSESFSELCLKVAMDPLQPLQIPHAPGLAQVVHRCLEKDPNHRFQNVAEVAAALAPYAQNPQHAHLIVERAARTLGVAEQVAAAMVPTRMATGPATPTSVSSSAGQMATPLAQTRASSSKKTGIIVGGLVAVAAAVALIVVLGTGGSDAKDDEAGSGAAAGAGTAAETEPGDNGDTAAGTATAATPDETGKTAAEKSKPVAAVDAGVAAATALPPDAAPAPEVVAKPIVKKPKKKRRRAKRKKKKKVTEPSGDGDDDVLGTRN